MMSALLALAVLTSDSTAAPAPQLPSQQEVLTFIADTIDWYRHLPTAQRIGVEPADLLFLEDNRPITTEVVRLSFEFGKAVAAIEASQDPAGQAQSKPAPPAASADVQYLNSAKLQLDADTQQAMNQLQSLSEARLKAHGADRKKLDTQMVEIRSRIQVLKAMSANYDNLLSFAQTASNAPDGTTSMAALVENLERTVPDVSAAAPSPLPTSNIPADASRAPYGIMGMISQVSGLARKEQVIDAITQRTGALTKSLQSVRSLLLKPFRQHLSALALDAKSLDVLEQQESQLTDLTAQVQNVSPAMAALTKQRILLNLYTTHLNERRSEIQVEYRSALKALLLRLGGLGGVIAILLVIGIVLRSLTYKHVHDLDARQVFLAGEQLLLGLIILAVIIFAFAFDMSSLATFLGLLSAGLAVGLHDILIAIGGYLLLVRKFHVRVGDRVEISGVGGEVTRIGLMQFELSEIDSTTGQRTGRVVFFSNSFVFVSPATPLFRQANAAA